MSGSTRQGIRSEGPEHKQQSEHACAWTEASDGVEQYDRRREEQQQQHDSSEKEQQQQHDSSEKEQRQQHDSSEKEQRQQHDGGGQEQQQHGSSTDDYEQRDRSDGEQQQQDTTEYRHDSSSKKHHQHDKSEGGQQHESSGENQQGERSGEGRTNGLLLLEHLNLNIMSEDVAQAFYCGFIGGMKAAKKGNMHVNCGPLTQFHLSSPDINPDIKEPQIWRGIITIGYMDADFTRLFGGNVTNHVPDLLRDTHFRINKTTATRCDVTGPYGNRFILRVVQEEEKGVVDGSTGRRPGSEGSAACGIVEVSLACQPGTAQHIAQYYNTVFGFALADKDQKCTEIHKYKSNEQTRKVQKRDDNDENDGNDESDREPHTSTHTSTVYGGLVGAIQKITYTEKKDYGNDTYPYTGDHLAMYISGFKESFLEACRRGVNWINAYYPIEEGGAVTLEDAYRVHQFRTMHIKNEQGDVMYSQEHEVREATHPSYACLER